MLVTGEDTGIHLKKMDTMPAMNMKKGKTLGKTQQK
jgi:hypothetical protein